jgi:hypothetical protein
LEEQKKIATEIQKEAYEQVIYVPLGQFLVPSLAQIALGRARRPVDASVLEH